MTPAVVIRPILLPASSVNQSLPSGPAVMPFEVLAAVWMENSSAAVMTPAVVMRPILLLAPSVNQSLPSGPAVMPAGLLLAVGVGTRLRGRWPG